MAALLCGCATPYQPLDETARVPDGFFESQLAPNIYEVHFDGNNASSRERVDDFALLRAAELCLRTGFRYFAVTSSRTPTNFARYSTRPDMQIDGPANVFGVTTEAVSTTTMRGAPRPTYTRPRQILVIGFLDTPTADVGQVFDAETLSAAIRSKYALTTIAPSPDIGS